MILIQQTFTVTGVAWNTSEWKRILREMWQATGEFWHKTMLPKHFTKAGAVEYDYQPRTIEYERRKARKMRPEAGGHYRGSGGDARGSTADTSGNLPLVYSGQMRRECESIRDIRALQDGVKIVLHGPPYMYQYHKPSYRVIMFSEYWNSRKVQAARDASDRGKRTFFWSVAKYFPGNEKQVMDYLTGVGPDFEIRRYTRNANDPKKDQELSTISEREVQDILKMQERFIEEKANGSEGGTGHKVAGLMGELDFDAEQRSGWAA